ncbi:hypothetical protein GDO81_009320 [Engystomops pustulosus]|uniref:Uncharacterized protein n=1 Tax=Engystomops pustulosus TaxID=76066 RepID=A0AAV7BQX6_ENGPU|nr:hypothetical protein GDO81_009320 [Engystomops pustulosus]
MLDYPMGTFPLLVKKIPPGAKLYCYFFINVCKYVYVANKTVRNYHCEYHLKGSVLVLRRFSLYFTVNFQALDDGLLSFTLLLGIFTSPPSAVSITVFGTSSLAAL